MHFPSINRTAMAQQRASRRTQWDKAARYLAIVMAAGVLFTGCSSKPEAEEAPTVTVQVDAAEKEAISRKVIADAVLYPRDQAAIVPKVVSSVKNWYVDRGSHVKAGDLLGELENQDLTAAQMKSQGGYAQAEVTYQSSFRRAPKT